MAAEGIRKPSDSMKPWLSLEGKVVLITGASSGIGRDLCLDLAKAGCRVLAAARRVDRLKSLCDEINGWGSFSSSSSSDAAPGSLITRAMAVELDVSAKGSEIEVAVQKAWSTFGKIDALLNNAGVRGSVNSPLDWPEEDWHNNISTNLTGSWLVSKYVCKLMRDSKVRGCVINMSSIGGIERGQLPGGLGYAASKTGLNAITKGFIHLYNSKAATERGELHSGEWLGQSVGKLLCCATMAQTDLLSSDSSLTKWYFVWMCFVRLWNIGFLHMAIAEKRGRCFSACENSRKWYFDLAGTRSLQCFCDLQCILPSHYLNTRLASSLLPLLFSNREDRILWSPGCT